MGTLPDTKAKGRFGSLLRQRIVVAGCLMAVLASAIWIYHFEFGSSDFNIPLQQAVGSVLAEEVVRTVPRPAKIVLVTVNSPNAPELKVQLDAFQREIKQAGGLTIQDKVVMDPGDNIKYRAGAGLSAKHLLKIIRKHASADAIVSLVGVPELPDKDLAQMKSVPKMIAETHSPQKLVNLLDKKILVAAIVPRFEFPAPGPHKPRTAREWFDRDFQIVTPETPLAVTEETP